MTQPGKEAQLRAERLAKALRANLGRRKSQARGRDALPAVAPPAAESAPEAGTDAEMSQKETG